MRQYIYAYYNRLAGFYGKPFFDNVKPEEFVPGFNQGLFGAPNEVLESLKEVDLYYLGSFDNVDGTIESKNDFLQHLSEIVAEIQAKKNVGVNEDVRKEN